MWLGLAHIFHEGGPTTVRFLTRFMGLHQYQDGRGGVHFVLFGFRLHVASQLARSPLIHSDGYASAGDHSNCIATYTLIPEPFMKYAG